MIIVGAYDAGSDGVELIVNLDPELTEHGPDGDVRPARAAIWRTVVSRSEWDRDEVAALERVAHAAGRELARRRPRPIGALAGRTI